MTCRTLEDFYHVNANTLEKQYKDVLSGYRTWSEASHADKWLVFPENVGPHLAIDETSLSNGELYTIVTNRDRHGRERCLVAIVAGTKAEDVIGVLEKIPQELLDKVEEVTLDLADSMRKIVRSCFSKAIRVIDRFHTGSQRCHGGSKTGRRALQSHTLWQRGHQEGTARAQPLPALQIRREMDAKTA